MQEINMRGTVLYGPRDIRFEERDAPTIINPTDAGSAFSLETDGLCAGRADRSCRYH
jgi:hypothetical protein